MVLVSEWFCSLCGILQLLVSNELMVFLEISSRSSFYLNNEIPEICVLVCVIYLYTSVSMIRG